MIPYGIVRIVFCISLSGFSHRQMDCPRGHTDYWLPSCNFQLSALTGKLAVTINEFKFSIAFTNWLFLSSSHMELRRPACKSGPSSPRRRRSACNTTARYLSVCQKIDTSQLHEKLSYRRGTALRAMLVNSCNVSKFMRYGSYNLEF